MGPLIDEPAVAKVERHVNDAVERGAELVLGGKRLEGQFFQPTVLTGVAADAAMSCEETFGPSPASRALQTRTAVRAANDTPYGLAAYFYSQSNARTWRVLGGPRVRHRGDQLGFISTEVAPFGGR